MSRHCSYCFKHLSSPLVLSSTNEGMSNSNLLFDTTYFRMDPLNNISLIHKLGFILEISTLQILWYKQYFDLTTT